VTEPAAVLQAIQRLALEADVGGSVAGFDCNYDRMLYGSIVQENSGGFLLADTQGKARDFHLIFVVRNAQQGRPEAAAPKSWLSC
jgi:hypothetical protein